MIQLKKMGREPEQTLLPEDIQMANRYMKILNFTSY